jgi:hypothetical protein
VEGTIYIGSRVCNHFDLADVEFGAFCVMFARFLSGKKVTDNWGRETFVSDHPMLDFMAEVYQSTAHKHLSS